MLTNRPKRQYSNKIVNLEGMVPKDQFLRVIEKHFDWNFIYDEVENYILTVDTEESNIHDSVFYDSFKNQCTKSKAKQNKTNIKTCMRRI